MSLKWGWGAAGVGALLVGVGVSRLAIVADDAMAPSLLPGDVVLILPGSAAKDDVVALIDPLEPSRWTLRRVEAIGGALGYRSGAYVTDAAEPLLDMGKDDAGLLVVQEGDHLTRHLTRNIDYNMEKIGVPDDAAFLGADNRDIALDSRWWGPVPLQSLQGLAVLRFGPPRNRWRTWVEVL